MLGISIDGFDSPEQRDDHVAGIIRRARDARDDAIDIALDALIEAKAARQAAREAGLSLDAADALVSLAADHLAATALRVCGHIDAGHTGWAAFLLNAGAFDIAVYPADESRCKRSVMILGLED